MISSEKKAKLIWNCRRGMLELDLLFSNFLDRCLDNLSQDQIQAFEYLLTQSDPDLYAWLMGYESPVNKELVEIVAFIRVHGVVSTVV